MRFILLFILSFTVYSQVVFIESQRVNYFKSDIDDLGLALAQIASNKPNIGLTGLEIAKTAIKVSREFSIPVNIILAISYIESSYRLNAVNKNSNDFGIMQVNAYHVRVSKLDKQKLLTDLEYSFYHGVRVFSWFYHRYPLDEAIMRYNCGTRKGCIELTSVKRYLLKVKRAL